MSLLPFVKVVRSTDEPGMKSGVHWPLTKLAGAGEMTLHCESKKFAQSTCPLVSGSLTMLPSSSNFLSWTANTPCPLETSMHRPTRISVVRGRPPRREAPSVVGCVNDDNVIIDRTPLQWGLSALLVVAHIDSPLFTRLSERIGPNAPS